MDAAELILNLVSLEQNAGQLGDFVTRDFIIEVQDWILRAQRANLELLRENHLLRQRNESPRSERAPQAAGHTAAPPLLFHAVVQSNRRQDQEVAEAVARPPGLELAPAV